MTTTQRLEVGQRATVRRTITDFDVTEFAIVSGDDQPVHMDDEYAAGTRFKRRIAHGMLTASLISAVLGTKLPGPGTIYLSQSLKFLAPVFIGDTVEATVEVTAIREVAKLEGPANRIVTLKTECWARGECVVSGEAVVLVEDKDGAI